MSIFLMHTLFAALTRVILIKVGLSNALIQVIVGLYCKKITSML